MDVQELISSGKLELYVAGVLSEREMADVAAIALEYKEVADEIEVIEKVMIAFFSPAEFCIGESEKEQQIDVILDKIHAQPVPENIYAPVSAPAPPPAPVKRLARMTWLAAALIAGLVVVTGLSVWFAVEDNNLTRQVADLRLKDQEMAGQNGQFSGELTRMEQQVNVMRNILTRRVELTNVKGNKITGQDNYILAYWNPQSQKLMLVDAKLPDLSPEQQYQLWALYDGKPIDAGVFDYKHLQVSTSFQKDIPNAQAFAVTVEPKGGSKTPTLSNLCMMGKL
jgi:hypothetical protein